MNFGANHPYINRYWPHSSLDSEAVLQVDFSSQSSYWIPFYARLFIDMLLLILRRSYVPNWGISSICHYCEDFNFGYGGDVELVMRMLV